MRDTAAVQSLKDAQIICYFIAFLHGRERCHRRILKNFPKHKRVFFSIFTMSRRRFEKARTGAPVQTVVDSKNLGFDIKIAPKCSVDNEKIDSDRLIGFYRDVRIRKAMNRLLFRQPFQTSPFPSPFRKPQQITMPFQVFVSRSVSVSPTVQLRDKLR